MLLNGSGKEARTGARALAVLAQPLITRILRRLATGPKLRRELRREADPPSQGALRDCLKELEAIGATARRGRRSAFPGSVEYRLAAAGKELRFVAVALDRWLAAAPEPLELGGPGAGPAIEALTGAWSATMLRALAARPHSPAELDGRTGGRDRPSPARRLRALRDAGMVEPLSPGGGDTPYAATEWLRRGIGPIVAASRWERRNLPAATAPIARVDAETTLLMAVPLVRLPPGRSGICRLAVELPEDDEGVPAEVTVEVADRRVVSCASPGAGAGAWATGPPASWFRTAIEADPSHLEIGGDRRLVGAIADALYEALFGRHARSQIRMP
jgi:DNA-binding HxlR family transcriptional regulator